MKNSFTFKKILPSVLIIAVLATGIFSSFGINVVNAEHNAFHVPDSEKEILGEGNEENFLQSTEINNSSVSSQSTNQNNNTSTLTDTELKSLLNKRYAIPQENLNKLDRDQLNAILENELSSEKNDDGSSKFTPEEILAISKGDLPPPEGTIRDGKTITGCNPFWGFNPDECLKTVAATLGTLWLSLTGFLVWVSGNLLKIAVDYTVLDFGSRIGGTGTTEEGKTMLGAVKEGWTTFRDLANIIIIFALLFIGIATILRLENYGMKKLLGTLIVVALLINFSLFFTNVVIDSSNLLAVQFHKQAVEKVGADNIGLAYMDALRIQSIYSKKTSSSNTIDLRESLATLSTSQIFLITIMGSILFLVTAFSFLAAAFLLIIRFVVLVFLMVLSPLAFVGMILPKTQKFAGQWWSALFRYAFFAPIYFLLSFVVLRIISSPAFQKSIGLFSDGNTATFASALDGNITIFLNFAIVIGFLIASLIIAQKLGLHGSDAVIKWGQSARKWGQGAVGGAAFGGAGRLMRTTAGRGASKLADSEKIKNRAASGGARGIFGRMQLRGLRGVAGSSFDARATKAGAAVAGAASLGKAGGKGGYQEKLKQQVKSQEKFAGSLVEVKRSSVDRIKEKNIRDNIQKATKSLDLAKNEFKNTQILHGENSPQAIKAKKEVDKEQHYKDTQDEEFETMQTEMRERGLNRQRQYANTLETEKTVGTFFSKAPRKNKEASDAIRKSMEDAPKKKNIKDVVAAFIEEGEKNESSDSGDKNTTT